MGLDTAEKQAFARKWPLWRLVAVAFFFGYTIWAMWVHEPTEWFVIPAAMAAQECVGDWRRAFRGEPTGARRTGGAERDDEMPA